MKGRKPLYTPETLKIGQRIQLKGLSKAFAYQYAAKFRKKFEGRDFKRVAEKGKIFIERVA